MAAVFLRVSAATLSRWESGKTNPRLAEAARIQEITGIVVYEQEETLTMRLQALEETVTELIDVLRGDADAAQRKQRLDAVAEAMGLNAPPTVDRRSRRPRKARGSGE